MIINKNLIRDYFIFSKRERRGVIALSLLIVAVWLSFFLTKALMPHDDWHFSQVKNDLIVLHKMQYEFEESTIKKKKKTFRKEKEDRKKIALTNKMPVDPNAISFKEWMSLGLNYQETCAIMNFRRKSGGFNEPSDLLKIVNLPEEKIKTILPRLKISTSETSTKAESIDTRKNEPHQANNPKEVSNGFSKKEKKSPEIFELNSCNARALRQFECLDSIAAQRILKKRKALGGFFSVNQLYEIDSLSANCLHSLVQYAVTDSQMIRKIDINSVTIKNLGRHPYIGYNIASALVNFRDKHGKFRNAEDLKRCMIMNKERIDKIKPYLVFGP